MWVDVEQIKGSTVDAMSLAVEDSAMMLIGVSRAYKGSSGCRLEAQYGMQRKIDMIPLMMEEGYQPDGWLGMLMQTRMWYPLYAATLASDAAFEDRMLALAREIGSRGRASGVAAETSAFFVTLPIFFRDSSAIHIIAYVHTDVLA
jgi:hypothetical protein